MRGILNFLESPAFSQVGVNLLKTFIAWTLLGMSMFFPVAGWHRLYLKLPGFYWTPVFGSVALLGVVIGLISNHHEWLLLSFPLSSLFAHDCLLVLLAIWRKQP